MTMGYSSNTFSGQHIQFFGFDSSSNFGALDQATIPYVPTEVHRLRESFVT